MLTPSLKGSKLDHWCHRSCNIVSRHATIFNVFPNCIFCPYNFNLIFVLHYFMNHDTNRLATKKSLAWIFLFFFHSARTPVHLTIDTNVKECHSFVSVARRFAILAARKLARMKFSYFSVPDSTIVLLVITMSTYNLINNTVVSTTQVNCCYYTI